MELNISSARRYNNVRTIAKLVRKELDTRFYPDEHGKYYYEKHLENALQHPTSAMIAMQEAKRKPLLNYPNFFERNIKIIEEKSGEVKTLKNSLNDIIDFLYPRTKNLREYIINNNRIEFDTIKRVKKCNFINKLKLLFK